MKKQHFLGWVITLVFIAFFIQRVDFPDVSVSLKGIQLGYMVVGIFFIFTYLLIFSHRWQVILGYFKKQIPLFQLSKIVNFSATLGDYTPGRIGDLTKIYLVRKYYKVKFALGVYTAALDKLYDVFLTSTLAFFGIWLIGISFKFNSNQIATSLVIFSVSIIFSFHFLRHSHRIVKKMSLFLSKKHMFPPRVAKQLKEIYHKKEFPRKLQLRVFVLAGLVRVMRLGVAYSFLLALGAEVNILKLLLVLSIGDALLLTPLTISGIGVVEAYTAIIFPVVLGISAPQAVAYAILYRFWTIVVHGIWFVVYTIDKPKVINNQQIR